MSASASASVPVSFDGVARGRAQAVPEAVEEEYDADGEDRVLDIRELSRQRIESGVGSGGPLEQRRLRGRRGIHTLLLAATPALL